MGKCCNSLSSESEFIVSLIESLQKLLAFQKPGIFGQISVAKIYDAKAKATDAIKLTLDGYVMMIYMKVFKEDYPKMPNQQQVDNINEIWDALKHPEKKISL
jgi:hypothetical protein